MTKKRALLLVAGFVLMVVGATFAFSPFGAPVLYTGIGITAHQTYEYTQEVRAERRAKRLHRRSAQRSRQEGAAFPAFEEDPLEELVDVSAAPDENPPPQSASPAPPAAPPVRTRPTTGLVGGLSR